MSHSLRFTGLRFLIALLLGLFLILGVHAGTITTDVDRNTEIVDRNCQDAWPVRCEAKKK